MRLLALIGALAILLVIGAAVFFGGGYYSVAGTAEEPAVLKWILAKVRMASVNRHAGDYSPAGFDSPAKVQDGARKFAEHGCANCHGAPGVDWAKFAEGLRPEPPELKDIVKDRTPSQLFWVVKNGINMTGMPSFGAAGVKDDDIWSIVAFVKKLPDVSEADYKSWTAPAPRPQ